MEPELVKQHKDTQICSVYVCRMTMSKISTFDGVNNWEHPLVVLVLCVFGTCRAVVVPAEVCSHMLFSC